MGVLRQHLADFVEQGALPAGKIEEALAATEPLPDGRAWQEFGDRLLLFLGSLALAFSVLFFVAYNWQDLGRLARFGMVEVPLVIAVGLYCKLGYQRLSGKVALLVASILLGVLLALFGQTYQTGVDPWHLFFNWALLMLPWALVARFPTLWILWVLLINVAIVQYYRSLGWDFFWLLDGETSALWLLFGFNTAVLVIWEALPRAWPAVQQRWAVRLLAIGSGLPLTWLIIYQILDDIDLHVSTIVVWLIWIAALHEFYRRLRPDLFMLTGACFSASAVLTTLVFELVWDDREAVTYLVLALVVVGLGAASAIWLRRVQQGWNA